MGNVKDKNPNKEVLPPVDFWYTLFSMPIETPNQAPEQTGPRAPKWQEELGLKSGVPEDDAAIASFQAISKIFSGLRLPAPGQKDEGSQRDRLSHWTHPKKPSGEPDPEDGNDFRYGIDYFFGKNSGKPESVFQNAKTAQFQGRKGVELWRIMKSVALLIPNIGLIIAHVRGDQQVDTEALAKIFGCNEWDITSANPEALTALGVEHGTVNPFVQKREGLRHVFDRDLVEGAKYPGDDVVFTSSGDQRFYVGFDVRRYLEATSPETAGGVNLKTRISKIESMSSRVIARRPIVLLGGDSGIDTAGLSQTLMAAVTKKLEEHKAHFGDRSLPRITTESDPNLAGSIDTKLYGSAIREHMLNIVGKLQESSGKRAAKPLVTFNSMAMHGVAGDILRGIEGIEYIGPKEAVEEVLGELKKQGVEIAHTVLLGLSSVYDKERSAFAGEILEKAAPVDGNTKILLQTLVDEVKVGKPTPKNFDDIVRKVLGRVAQGRAEEKLLGQNIVIVLGASELESFADTAYKAPEQYVVIKSNDAAAIAAELASAPADKIRLILIQPGKAVADMIAKKTLGLT